MGAGAVSFWRDSVEVEPENERDSFADLELPTSPGQRAAKSLYDRDLYELVGRLLAHAAKEAKRSRALRAELRTMRVELRRVTRRQTALLGGAAIVFEVATRLLEKF